MTVPPGDIRCPESFGCFVAKNDFFERLIQGVAKVKVPIGKRGAVMEQKKLSILVLLLDFTVQIDFFPVAYSVRFTLAKIRPHREGSLWQFERIFIVFSHALGEECADIVDRSLSVKVGESACEKGLPARFPMIAGNR